MFPTAYATQKALESIHVARIVLSHESAIGMHCSIVAAIAATFQPTMMAVQVQHVYWNVLPTKIRWQNKIADTLFRPTTILYGF
jgi:hypothetical protein